jgi:hypothetical protein
MSNRHKEQLMLLRISVARIAQALALDLRIPGAKPETAQRASFDALVDRAQRLDRGWNDLCLAIITELEARGAIRPQQEKTK